MAISKEALTYLLSLSMLSPLLIKIDLEFDPSLWRKKTGLIICGTYFFIYWCLGDNDTRYTDGFHKFHPSFYTGSKKATRSERGSIQTHYRKTKHYFRVAQFFFSKLSCSGFSFWIQLEMFTEFSDHLSFLTRIIESIKARIEITLLK